MGLVKTKIMIGSQVYHYDQIDAFDSALSLLSQTRQDLSGLFGRSPRSQLL
jgi:hypothetical protein